MQVYTVMHTIVLHIHFFPELEENLTNYRGMAYNYPLGSCDVYVTLNAQTFLLILLFIPKHTSRAVSVLVSL